jgi:hypothetical protein
MDTNPIKYRDLILPDDSIENLIKQLDEANEAYNNIGNSIKEEAQRISAAMRTVSGATNEGREATRGYSESAQKLLKAERDLNFARSETAQKIAELKALKKDEQTITKLTIQLNRSAEGSYDALSAQYSLNKIRLNAMTQSARENTEVGRKLEQETAAIYEKMNELQKATGKYTLQVGNYELATKNLTKELKEMQKELAAMEAAGLRGSDAYNELAQKAGALQDNIQDARNEIKRYASDTRLLDDTVDIVTSASAAWQVYQGAVNAFGIESKEAMEAMAKLQGIIAITNGLQKLNAQFTNNASATYKVYHAVLRFVGLEEKALAVDTAATTVATEANTAATEAAAVAQTANAAATNAATVSLKAFRTALITTGIGALVVAIGALIAYWDDLKEMFGGLTDAEKSAIETTKILNKANEESYKVYGKAAAEMELYKEKVETFNGTQEDEKRLVDELNQKYGDALGKYETLNEWKERLALSGEAYCQVLQKEAELQALLDAYQSAYLERMALTQKLESGGYKAWYRTKAGELKLYREEQKALDERIEKIKENMKTVVAEQKMLQNVFDINLGTTTTTTGKQKSTKTNETDDEQKRQDELLSILRKTQEIRNSMIEDGFTRETAIINQKYAEQIEDLRKRAETEVELRDALNEQIKALEEKQALDLADVWEKYAQKAADDKKKLEEQKKKAADEAYKTQLDAITKEAQLQQLLIGNMSVNAKKKEELSLQAEKERLQKIYDLNVKAGKDITSLEMQTLQEQIKKADKAITKAKKPQDVYDLLGLNLDDDQKAAISQSFDFAIEQLGNYLDAWVKASEQKVELANKEVESAQAALDAEREARANGYASNVAYAQKELDNAKQNQQKALKEQERAQKAQQQLATVQQMTNLVTASALIWSQLGFPWAIPAIAVMWGSFAAAKIKAAELTSNEKYGEGTVELLQGGSHQSGNDIDLGRKKDGTRRRAEGGEFFAVINKRNSRKYRTIVPDVINALNSGTFEEKYGNAYPQDIAVASSPTADLSDLKRDVTAIREQGESKTYTDERGTHVIYRNLHRVILN